jgi:Uma2 family endonuclease
MPTANIEAHRWTRAEYERMAEAGLLREGRRTELVNGVLYDLTQQTPLHAAGVSLGARALRRVFGAGFEIRVRMPLTLDPDSMPEPDLAVVRGTARDYLDAHPTTALLVVEVAHTSLPFDRRKKAPLYARAGIPELWILDLEHSALQVYREPGGRAYGSVALLRKGESIRPLAAGLGAAIPIADLLP